MPVDTVIRTGGIRVLVVDDNVDHRLLMARALEGHGIDVTECATADEALVRAAEADLVLLDYRLPGMSGLEVLDRIRLGAEPPSVVLVTAQGNTDTVIEAMRRGAIDYVRKESGYLTELPTVIRRAWRQHDLDRRSRELQRLALVVADADSVERACSAVVEGARRLLRARGVVLAVEEEGRLRIRARTGEEIDGITDLLEGARAELPTRGDGTFSDGALVVSLPGRPDEPLGLLVVDGWARDDADPAEELGLARTFAAFAGTALRNLRRHDLERELIGELQRTIEARRDFIASISHELRTPLTSIGGYAETVLTRWDQISDEQKKEFLGRVRSNASQLARLIEELIDLASMERGRGFVAHVAPVGLNEAVTDALADMELFLSGRSVDVDVADVRVSADPELFQRCLANLLSNAVKYSSPGSPIRVAALVGHDNVRLDVTDEGIGLAPGDAARVFEPFYRSSYAVANAVRGSGIGLALVREYVTAMGGEVAVTSRVGQGSTFSFTLPLAG